MHVARPGDRFQVLRELGRGGMGVVHLAHDRLHGGLVAVKRPLDTSDVARERARREALALRLVKVRGVVPWVDDGDDALGPFLVTAWIDGAPFPGRAPDLLALAVRTLEALARVHAVGVLHLDLKPGNVLVDAQGEPHLLDFGVAQAPGTAPFAAGTLRYQAPEQIEGGRVDGRTDLYAVGAMLYEALVGAAPFADGGGLYARSWRDPAPVAGRPDVPAALAGLVDRLVARLPDQRPATAVDALRSLRPGDAHGAFVVDAATEPALRARFWGPEKVLHLPERGARALAAATASDPARVPAVVADWVAAGWATVEGGKIRLRDDAGVALEPDPPLLRLMGLVKSGAYAEAADLACVLGERWLADGHAVRAAHAAEVTWLAARGRARAERRLLGLWVRAAHASEDTERRAIAARHARAAADRLDAGDLADLAEASVALGRRQFTLAEGLVDGLAFDDEALALLQVAVRIEARHRPDPVGVGEVLDALAPWATTPEREARRLGWLGLRAYRLGEFDAAAALHLAAAPLRADAGGRLGAEVNAALALLEAGRIAEAEAVAAAVIAAARGLPALELRAWSVVRTAGYRRGEALGPDLELVDAARRVAAPAAAAPVVFTEATIAWRARHPEAGALCREARQGFAGLTMGEALCDALALLVTPDAAHDVAGLERRIYEIPSGRLRDQLIAIVRLHRAGVDPSVHGAPMGELRMEILTATEVARTNEV